MSNSNNYLELVQTDASTTSYAKTTGLTVGEPYNFIISALNDIGEGSYSEPPFLVYAARTPDAPTDLATVSTSSTHITFTWVIPYDGGSEITYYHVLWDEGAGGTADTFSQLAITTDPDNTFTIDYSLTPGDSYQFAVKAVNIVGPGSISEPASFIAASLPSQPNPPYKVSATTGSIEIAWITPADNGSPIIDFKLYQSINFASFTLVNVDLGTSTSYTLSSVNSGSAYKYRVVAINSVGESNASADSDVIIAANAPDPPVDLERIYADGSMITIEWTAPIETGGIPVIDYKVFWDYGEGGTFVEIASTTSNDKLFT